MADDPVVQTTYPEMMPVAVAGMPATMTTWDADTKFVETAAGIDFARAVSRGASEKGVVIGGAATFIGVTYRDITLVTQVGGTVDKIPQKSLAGIMIRGDIWVDVSAAVVAGDPVIFNATTGRFGGATGSQIAGAEWIRGQATVGGLALLRLGGKYTVTTVA